MNQLDADPTGTDDMDLNLTQEELNALREDGVIPPDWAPGSDATGYEEEEPDREPDADYDEVPIGESDTELPPELGALEQTDMRAPQAPVPQVTPAHQVDQSTALLRRYEQESPTVRDPALQRFSDIALRWLPTDDTELKRARSEAQKSADQLAELRVAAEKAASEYPWESFAAEMLGPKTVGTNFLTSLASSMKAAGTERSRRQKVAQDLTRAEAEAGMRMAQQRETGEMNRIRAGADLAKTAASMRGTGGVPSGFAKTMRDLGIDINTPEGQKAARRLYLLEQAKGDPLAIQTLLKNPQINDPFSDEFAEALKAEHAAAAGVKEAEAAAKGKRAEAEERRKEAREGREAAKAKISLQEAQQRMARTRQLMEQAKKGGVAGGKVPTEIQRQQLALKTLDSGIAVYEEALSHIDPRSFDQLDPDKQAQVKSILADLIISWKEAAALGALSGPDVGMIERTLTDPFSAKGAWYGKKGLAEQLKQARASVTRKKAAIEEQYNIQAGPAGGGASPKELRQRTPSGRIAIYDGTTKKFLRWE